MRLVTGGPSTTPVQEASGAKAKPIPQQDGRRTLGPAVLLSLSARSSFANASASLLQRLPPDLAKAAEEKQRGANSAMEQMLQIKKSMISDQKGAAREKVEQARRKLQMLRQFGGDPKTVARQAKQIAQEIKAAAKEYAQALKSEGGSGAEAAVSAESLSASEAPVSTSAEVSPAAEAATGTESAEKGSLLTPPAETETPDTSKEPSDVEASASVEATPADKALSGMTVAADPEAARQRSAKAYQDAAASIADKANRAQGERDVLQMFKDVAGEAKRLLQEAARKLREKNASDPDAREADTMGAALDKSIDDLGDAVDEALGTPEGAGTAMPMVDVSASAGTVDLLG